MISVPGVKKLFGSRKLFSSAWIWFPAAVGSSQVLLFVKNSKTHIFFRYGVFEEHGYPGDERYPTFYTQQIWTADGPE